MCGRNLARARGPDPRHNGAVSGRFVVGVVLVVVAGWGAELTDDDKKQTLGPDSGLTIDAAIDAPPPVDARPCMGGDTHVQDAGGTCFLLLAGPKERTAAEADCVALGGHLATIRNASENATVATLVAATPSAFLGANDLVTEGTFLWP